MYVNINTNHPPTVLKNIPLRINSRLSMISANKSVFDAAAAAYQEALPKSGYQQTLAYETPSNNSTKKKCRKKSVTWFNPPYSKNVKSNIEKDFLQLLDTAFPPAILYTNCSQDTL